MAALSVTSTSRAGSAYGSGLINAASTNPKIAVLAPMPSVRIRIAVTAKPGLLRNCRNAKRTS